MSSFSVLRAECQREHARAGWEGRHAAGRSLHAEDQPRLRERRRVEIDEARVQQVDGAPPAKKSPSVTGPVNRLQ